MNTFIAIAVAAILVTILLTRTKVEEEYKDIKNDNRSTTKSLIKTKR
jgi:hypothetical protein